LEKFAEYPEAVHYRNNKIYVDLPAIIERQLLEAGLQNQNIEIPGECTFCLKEKYFSFRRDPFGKAQGRPERSRGGDKPKNVEAMVAYIGLKGV
jgi:copper oxidase (laccase) domain-containing protein